MIKLAFHKSLWAAYVYTHEGDLLAFRVFTHDLDAAAWARRRSLKTETFGPLPWCVRAFVETTGEGVKVVGELMDTGDSSDESSSS